MKKFLKTLFPRIVDESTPPEPSSDNVMNEEDVLVKREETYNSKEDEDVAVFLIISKKLSMKSLLFLLQNHAKSMLIPESELQESLKSAAADHVNKKIKPELLLPPPKPVKKVRFADVQGGVRTLIHSLPPREAEDVANIWWSEHEMQEFRVNATRVVHYFRKHKRNFQESITVLAGSDSPDADEVAVDHHMKKLTEDSLARGLEPHIVFLLHTLRKNGVQSVLVEQEACRKENCEYSATCKRVRDKYAIVGLPCRALANRMAECDHVDALKASLSKWESMPSLDYKCDTVSTAKKVCS